MTDETSMDIARGFSRVIDMNDLKAVRKVLYKYQARYHGASVMAQADWDEGQRCLALLDKWISK